MSTTPSPDPARFFNAARPPRTEPTYPPEPQEALPKTGGPSPFRAAERQPPRIVLTADEAAERMKRLKDGEPSGDPVLKRLVAEQKDCIDDLFRENDALKQRMAEMTRHLDELTTTFLQFRESAEARLPPPAAATAPPAKKTAAKRPKKP